MPLYFSDRGSLPRMQYVIIFVFFGRLIFIGILFGHCSSLSK
ncbi:hypothetical protein PMI23_01568 [Pseudomonas sp. GM24]|nr:hypothetical protein PMI19_03613 [Pseudomonas sp. GM16]EJM42301.1 hypothetical protein PMI23_01568 [Pseudomonas sp. GM24]